MPCKSCGSVNQKNFSAEMGIHFLELKDIDKPTVWVFPEVILCLDCGMAEFSVWGFRTMPISVPEHADHRFRVDGDHDSGMMPITRSGMIPIS